MRALVDTLRESGAEVLPVHVFDKEHVPAFLERWEDLDIYGSEFSRRHAPTLAPAELRTGLPAAAIIECGAEKNADAVLIEWKQRLDEDHATVVSGLLERSTMPLLLLPEGTDHGC
jgi:hypothetical protein